MPARSSHPLLNALGFLAYLSCLFQWTLAILPFLPGVLDSDLFVALTPSPTVPGRMDSAPEQTLPDWLTFFIIAGITLIVLVVTVVAITRLPRTVGQGSQKIIRSAAEHVLPVVTHHTKLSKKKRQLLTARIVFNIKLAVLTLPIIILLVVPVPETAVSRQALLLIVGLAAGWSLMLFSVQALLARRSHVSLDKLW